MKSPAIKLWSGLIKTALPSLVQFALMFVVSVFVLVDRGLTMCEPFFFLAFSCFSGVVVGPILVNSYRQNPNQSMSARLTSAVWRSTGAVLLILIWSLILVNVFFWYGQVTLPSAGLCAWAVALSLAASTSAASMLGLVASYISLNAVKWGFRVIMLAMVLAYKTLLPTWTVSWYSLIDEWGINLVALGWWILLAAISAGALLCFVDVE